MHALHAAPCNSTLIVNATCRRVGLLKIDVERAELQVLRGLGPDDWSMVEQVAMEVHAAAAVSSADEGRLQQVQALLREAGFANVRVEQDVQLAGTTLYNVHATR